MGRGVPFLFGRAGCALLPRAQNSSSRRRRRPSAGHACAAPCSGSCRLCGRSRRRCHPRCCCCCCVLVREHARLRADDARATSRSVRLRRRLAMARFAPFRCRRRGGGGGYDGGGGRRRGRHARRLIRAGARGAARLSTPAAAAANPCGTATYALHRRWPSSLPSTVLRIRSTMLAHRSAQPPRTLPAARLETPRSARHHS